MSSVSPPPIHGNINATVYHYRGDDYISLDGKQIEVQLLPSHASLPGMSIVKLDEKYYTVNLTSTNKSVNPLTRPQRTSEAVSIFARQLNALRASVSSFPASEKAKIEYHMEELVNNTIDALHELGGENFNSIAPPAESTGITAINDEPTSSEIVLAENDSDYDTSNTENREIHLKLLLSDIMNPASPINISTLSKLNSNPPKEPSPSNTPREIAISPRSSSIRSGGPYSLLHHACYMGYDSIISFLVDECDYDLYVAASENLPDSVTSYWPKQITAQNPETSFSPLHLAALAGHTSVLEALKTRDFDQILTSDTTHLGLSLRHLSAYSSQACFEMVSAWESEAIQLTETGKESSSVLSVLMAVLGGNLDTLQALALSKTAMKVVTTILEKSHLSLLVLAAAKGHAHVMRWLMDTYRLEIPFNIIKEGVPYPRSLAHIAANSLEVLQLLAEKQFSDIVTVTCAKGMRVQHYAAASSDVIRWLSTFEDFDPNAQISQDPKNALVHLAAINNDTSMLRLLKQLKADLSMLNGEGHAALRLAAKHGSLRAFKYLWKDAKVSPTMYTQCVAAAIANGHIPILEYLHLKSQKNPNFPQIPKMTLGETTSIHLAATHGYLDLVKWLIYKGASPTAKNSLSLTPYVLAKQNCHKNVVDWLTSMNYGVI